MTRRPHDRRRRPPIRVDPIRATVVAGERFDGDRLTQYGQTPAAARSGTDRT